MSAQRTPGTRTPPFDDGAATSRQLLERARGGDAEALDELCGRYLPRLRRFGRGRLPPWARERLDTDDLVQETLQRTLGRLDALDPGWEGTLQAYLRRALLNRVKDEVRRAGRRPLQASAGEQRDPRPSPLEELIGAEAVERFESALERLSEPDRAAVVARMEMRCSYRELAELLGKPSTDAARMAVSRALVRLAREMDRG